MEYLATIGNPLNDRYPIRTENIKTRSFLIYRFHIGKLFLFEISSTDHSPFRFIDTKIVSRELRQGNH
jgi:hypothetical protein